MMPSIEISGYAIGMMSSEGQGEESQTPISKICLKCILGT